MEVVNGPAPAIITVSLPADATLTINDQPTTSTAAVRTFETPVLPPGREYYYTLRAEVTRNGQRLTTTREVPVSAGQTSHVTLEFPPAGTARR
jgi:uncharacterized protein (TIGR03000 family)